MTTPRKHRDEGMKKYLITEEQITHIYNCGYAGAVDTKAEIIKSLKPIESLSDKVLWDLAADHFSDEADYCLVIEFARAIERHILGETESKS